MTTKRFGAVVFAASLLVACAAAMIAQTSISSVGTYTVKRNSTQSKLLSANSTSATFTYTAGGRNTLAPGTTTIVMPAGARGIRLVPYGAGSNNDTFDFRVWLVRRPLGSSGGVCEIEYFGGGTATLSTAVGSSSDLVTSSERFADTLTWATGSTATTPKGIGSLIEASNGLGTSFVYSPADNTPASLSIPDCGGATEILIDFDMTGATSGNFLVETGP